MNQPKRNERVEIGMRHRATVFGIVFLSLVLCFSSVCRAEGIETAPAYHLEQVVVLSRHGIRAPLSNSGSAVAEMTPHAWLEWTAPDSELTLKGGVAETLMGQYFRKWLESEGLLPENCIPAEGETRFYANARQRTIATARYFSAGFLPVANVTIEYKDEIGAFDPVFKPVYTFMSDAYRQAVLEELAGQFGLWEDGTLRQALTEDYALLADVIDYEESHGFQSGEYAPWTADDIQVVLEEGKETAVKGSLKTAMAASDALLLQYYEEDDALRAAFGHEMSAEDWGRIADINTTYQAIRYNSRLIGVNVAHPMLVELLNEMQNPERKFSFLCGHDSNVASVLGALGVTDYRLPETAEKKTPIGCKLVFEKWSSDTGEKFTRVRLVYQSTKQLRQLQTLTLENPPISFFIDLPGLEKNEVGFYRLDDMYECLQNAIDAYDALIEAYGDSAALDNAA